MLPISRRDRYDNAKRRRGGVLKTMLRKEGRLIRQLIVFLLLVAAVLCVLRWLPRGTTVTSARDVSKEVQTPPDEQFQKLDSEHTPPSEQSPTTEDESKPKVGGETMPHLSIGGKRFLPMDEAEEVMNEREAKEKLQGAALSLDGGAAPLRISEQDKENKQPRKEAKHAELADLLSKLDAEQGTKDRENRVDGSNADPRNQDRAEGKKLEKGGLRGSLDKASGEKSEELDGGREEETSVQIAAVDGFGKIQEGEGANDSDGGARVSDTAGLDRMAVEDGANEGEEANEGEDEQKTNVLPKVIKGPSKRGGGQSWDKKRDQVVAAFENAWTAYRKHAWGHDELRPVSQQGEDGLGGLGATIVDALDTAMIMGLKDVVEEAGAWIDRELPSRLETQGYVNLFETTIRVLGGLLSAYHLSGGGNTDLTLAGGAGKVQGMGPPPEVYLKRAVDLGERLMSAFASPSAVPFSDVHLSSKTARAAQFDGGSSSTAEVATLGMEFCYLSKLTGDSKYCDAALGVVKHIRKQQSVDGLVPIFINPHSGHFDGNNIRLGSRGDSYYEYLVKVWMQKGGAEKESSDVRWLREMWDESMNGVKSRLLGSSIPSGLLFVGERPNGLRAELTSKMDHLVCFLAGALALGATKGRTLEEAMSAGDFSEVDKDSLRVAKELTQTCYAMYDVTLTGLAPEIAYFNTGGGVNGMPPGNSHSKYLDDILIQPLDRHNLLRPETVESLFVLYRITGDEQYRQWGWEIFQSFELHAKVVSGGYTSLHDVTKIPAPTRDKMETFFLGETLKYLYLLFSDLDVLPLNRFVFNTEAHPLPIWASSPEVSVSQRNTKQEQ